MTTSALAKLDRINTMLAEASTLPEAKKIKDMAEAAQVFAKRAHLGRDVQCHAAEIALLAAHKAGAILKTLQRAKPKAKGGRESDSDYERTLKESKTPKRTAQRWQKIASSVSEHAIKKYCDKIRKEETGDISAAGLLRETDKRGRVVASATDDPAERKRAMEDGYLGIFPLEMLASFQKIKTLSARFGAPPFSTLDLRQSYWSEHKRAWEELGIRGEAGRGDEHEAVYEGTTGSFDTSISEFHPALTETMYDWFAPKRGHILDPFAGGSTRGIVAARKDYMYTGIELRPEQIEENRKQLENIRRGAKAHVHLRRGSPTWIEDTGENLSGRVAGQKFDLIFTCPPYWNRERYTKDDDRDLSRCKTYPEFIRRYEAIFRQAVAHLKENRFAVVVIADIRNPEGEHGWCINLVGDTISCFERLGLHYYNQLILLDPIGNSARHVGTQWTHYRKVQKTHQNVLVFWKGDDEKRIPEVLGVLKEVDWLGAKTHQDKPREEEEAANQFDANNALEALAKSGRLKEPGNGVMVELLPPEARAEK
jgi:16S rRNA G966 N2-methylase RsmD